MLKNILRLVIALPASMAVAEQIPVATKEFFVQCRQAAHCEIEIFKEVSKTFRPSKNESALREYIKRLQKVAEQEVWKTTLPLHEDKIGNIMITLPSTMKNKKVTESFALQSHMDMVLAYKNATPGEDLKKYFRDGVTTQVTDGWIHSKDKMTTLGADNGIGVAIQLRYLMDPELEHPPLELIFTVQEETGLIGAMQFELPMKSSRMISLDGMSPTGKTVIVGSQGAFGENLSSHTTAEKKEPSNFEIRVLLNDLAGGHSGNDIHRDRANSAKVFAKLYKYILAKVPEVKIQSVTAGDPGVLNKIPNGFVAVLTFPRSVDQQIQKDIEYQLRKLIAEATDENPKYRLEISVVSEASNWTLSSDFAEKLVNALLQTPNGKLLEGDQYPNKVLTSSNLSYFQVAPGVDNQLNLSSGYLTRSFSNKSLQEFAKKSHDSLVSGSGEALAISPGMDFPSWSVPSDSKLLAQALSLKKLFNGTSTVAVGLEPSAFLQKYKNLDVIALAPFVQFAHTVNEALEIESVKGVMQGLDQILKSP